MAEKVFCSEFAISGGQQVFPWSCTFIRPFQTWQSPASGFTQRFQGPNEMANLLV